MNAMNKLDIFLSKNIHLIYTEPRRISRKNIVNVLEKTSISLLKIQ
jgi:hypothetical protein